MASGALPDIRQVNPRDYRRELAKAKRDFLLALRRAVRAEAMVKRIRDTNPLLVEAVEREVKP